MADFDGVAQRAIRIDAQTRTAVHAGIAAACEGEGRARVPRQQCEEFPEALRVIMQRCLELPQDRPEFIAQIEYPRREEIGERPLHILQAQDMRDVAWSLD